MTINPAYSQQLASSNAQDVIHRKGWRSSSRRVLSAAVTVALVAGTVLATGGVASAAAPVAQSQGRFLAGTVLGGDLASIANIAPASASALPATTTIKALDVTALNAVDVNLGGAINLLGTNGILTLGAVNQYATAAADGSSSAASGAVTDTGAISIGANGNANPGVAASNATLNLNSVLAATPALQAALSKASVNVGALAATATETAAGVQSGTYKIGSLGLDLTSPVLPPVYGTVNTAVGTVLTTVGALGLITGLPTAPALLAPLTTITSADGSFVINLQTGVVHVDVAKLLAGQTINGQPGDINKLPPNTLLLPYIVTGLTTQLLPAITSAITGPTGVIQNLTTQLGNARLLGLPISLGILNPLLSTLTGTLNGLVSGLGTSVVAPLTTGLNGLVSLTANVQPVAPNTGVAYSNAALSIGVVPVGQAASVTLAAASVGPNAGPVPVPTIDVNGLSPNSGPVAGNTTVTVTGTGFVVGGTTVNIGGQSVPATATSTTSLTFVTPAHVAGGVPVTVTAAGGTSTPAQTFTYLALPTVSVNGLSPNSGPIAGNTTVTVTGTGFVVGGTTVNIGGQSVPATATSTTSLTFVTPAHAVGPVPVTVHTLGGDSTPAQTFTYLAAPTITITGLSPASGPVAGDTTVTVTGTGFVPGATTVLVDGQSLPANATSDTTLTFVTPPHVAGPVDVSAVTAGGTSSPPRTFTFVDLPTISANGLSPASGPVAGNTTVTVTGTGFIVGATSVNIGTQNVPATATSSTSLTFVTPAHAAGPVDVTVQTAGGTSTPAQTFTYLVAPTITISGLSPASGPVAGNTKVTVTGTGFVPGATTVNVDGVNQPANATSTTTLTFVTPAHVAGAVDITAKTDGGTSAPAQTFTFVPLPTIAIIGGLSPTSGPVAGNTTVTVTGTGFVPGATTVNVDSVNQPATATSSTTLTFVTKAHPAGPVDVTVQTAGGVTAPRTFTFLDVPTIAAVDGLSPSSGPVAGGTLVTVTGTGFVVGATSVIVDGQPQSASATSATSLTFTTTPHAAGPVLVTVQTAGGVSTPGQTFTFLPVPTALTLAPSSGPVAGNTPVTVTGTGFVPGAIVHIGGASVEATVLSPTTLTFLTPAHLAGPVGVTVETNGGISGPALPFTYLDIPTILAVVGLSPNLGPVAGLTTVTVTGTGFVVGATSVNVDGVNQPAVATSDTTLTFVTAPHPAGPVGVTVKTAGGTSTPAQTFTFVAAPTATLLTPDHGPTIGLTPVTVTGTGFVPGSTSVTIGGIDVPAALVTVLSPTSLTFVTPPHAAGLVQVSVTTPGGTTDPTLLGFTYGPPTIGILGLAPDHGPVTGATTVTVTGTGFVANATSVNVDGVNQPATVTSSTSLTFVTNPHTAGPVDVTVQTSAGLSNPMPYTFLGVPTALSLTPDNGPTAGGTHVIVTGSGFFPGVTSVLLDGVPVGEVTVLTPTSLTFDTPPHAPGAVGVTVMTVGGTSTPALPFTFGPPTIDLIGGLSPVHGPAAGGTTVTITGTGFVPGSTSVNVDGVSRPATVTSTTSLTFVTPAHPVGKSQVTVTTPGGTSTPYQVFTFDPPTVTSLTPGGGPVAGGTPITIIGTGFAPGLTTIDFGGVTIPSEGVTISPDGTTATFDSPPGAGPGAVVVTVITPQATAAPGKPFVYGPPVTTLLNPGRGPATGGTVVTITGVGFVPGATTVSIGGSVVPAVAVLVSPDGTHATFATPPHFPALVDVFVTTAGGTSTPALPFLYDPLAALSLSPDHGPSTGSTPVTIVGTGFVPGRTSVTIGGIVVPAALVTVDPLGTTALFNTPAHAAGGVLVTATTPGGTTNPLGYLYDTGLPTTSCVLTGINPLTGLQAATVTVLASTGTNTSLVPSTLSITTGPLTAGSTPVLPLLGGFVSASISVPVTVGTTSVGYVLAPVVFGIYSPVTGGPIPCTTITGPQTQAGAYHPLAPYRLLDSRYGNGASAPIPAGKSLTVQVRGRGGVPGLGQRPGQGVATVMLNVTTTNSTQAGFLSVYPGTTRPTTSSINFAAKTTVANLVAAAVAADGTVTIYNGSVGSTDVVADVQGYFSDGDTVAPGSFVPLAPSRILDTMYGNGAPTATVAPGAKIKVKVTGVGGVPTTNVAAVVLNLTVDQPTANGFITVYPNDPKPLVSSLNFHKGQTAANLVIIPVASDGTVTIYNGSLGSVRLVADVSGFFRGGTAILDGEFVPVAPDRLLDTRIGTNVNGKVAPLGTIAPTVLGRNGIPLTGVSAVVTNLTVTSTTGSGFITAYPQGTLPLASNLNFVAGLDRPNAVIARVGSDGKVRLYNGAVTTPVDLVADVSGYFISNPVLN